VTRAFNVGKPRFALLCWTIGTQDAISRRKVLRRLLISYTGLYRMVASVVYYDAFDVQIFFHGRAGIDLSATRCKAHGVNDVSEHRRGPVEYICRRCIRRELPHPGRFSARAFCRLHQQREARLTTLLSSEHRRYRLRPMQSEPAIPKSTVKSVILRRSLPICREIASINEIQIR
jgi:hypothetical protein